MLTRTCFLSVRSCLGLTSRRVVALFKEAAFCYQVTIRLALKLGGSGIFAIGRALNDIEGANRLAPTRLWIVEDEPLRIGRGWLQEAVLILDGRAHMYRSLR